jgi:hypothetical protein
MPVKDNETIKRDLADYIVNQVYGIGEAPWDRDYEDSRKIATFLIHWVMFQQNEVGRAQRAATLDWEAFLRSDAVQNMSALKIMPELERIVYRWYFGRELDPRYATAIPEALLVEAG